MCTSGRVNFHQHWNSICSPTTLRSILVPYYCSNLQPWGQTVIFYNFFNLCAQKARIKQSNKKFLNAYDIFEPNRNGGEEQRLDMTVSLPWGQIEIPYYSSNVYKESKIKKKITLGKAAKYCPPISLSPNIGPRHCFLPGPSSFDVSGQ